MILSVEQMNEFEVALRPLKQFLEENCDPLAKVIVEINKAELVQGEVQIIFESSEDEE